MEACREWQEAIVEYVDGRCALETAVRLERHVSTCEACAHAVHEQQWLKQAMRQVPPQHAPAHLSRRIRDHARASLRRRSAVRTVWRLSFATTAVAVLAVLGWWWNASREPVLPALPQEDSTLAQAIVQEYVGATAHDGFSDPSLQMLAREAQMKTLRAVSVSQ